MLMRISTNPHTIFNKNDNNEENQRFPTLFLKTLRVSNIFIKFYLLNILNNSIKKCKLFSGRHTGAPNYYLLTT